MTSTKTCFGELSGFLFFWNCAADWNVMCFLWTSEQKSPQWKKCWYSKQKNNCYQKKRRPLWRIPKKADRLLCNIAAHCLSIMCALYTSARLQFTGVEIVLKLESTNKDHLSASQLNANTARLGLRTNKFVRHWMALVMITCYTSDTKVLLFSETAKLLSCWSSLQDNSFTTVCISLIFQIKPFFQQLIDQLKQPSLLKTLRKNISFIKIIWIAFKLLVPLVCAADWNMMCYL